MKEGYGLNCRIEPVTSGPLETWRVTDLDKEQSFLICLADKLSLESTTPLNLALQCRLKTVWR